MPRLGPDPVSEHVSPAPESLRRFAVRFPLTFDIVFSVLIFALAFLLASTIPTSRTNPVFVFFTVAVAYATWIAGLRAGVFTFALTVVAALWFAFAPHDYPHIVNEGLLVRLAANLTVCALTLAVVTRLRSTEIHNIRLNASAQHATRAAESERRRAVDILESITDAFCALDPEWRFTHVNHRTVQILRKEASELLGQNIWEVYPADLEVRHLYEQVMRSRKPTSFDRYFQATQSWLEVHAYPAPDGGLLIFFHDITERRLTDEKLRENEQMFRAVAENIPQMIWVSTASAEFRYLSPKWLEYTGTTLDQNANGKWLNPIHPDDRERTAAAWNRAIAENGIFEAEYRARRYDGVYRWQLARAVPIEGSTERLWFGSSTDIEDQKKAQVALIRSEKLASVGRMAATVAHEINNPLEAIMNVVYLASVDTGLSEEGKRLLALAQQELIRVAHITRQTLGFYRESGAPAHVSLPDVVDGVVDLLGPRLKTKGVRVIRDYRQSPPVFAIRGELLQVLSNLIGNAMDAMSNGHGAIHIRISPVATHTAGPSVRLTVCDTGTGISRDALPHIFEPFFTTKESFGTGLGLWVSKGIIEKHHGTMSVRSTPGRGTTFSVVLPTVPQPIERSA